jgi:hypothetical protein
MQARPELVMRLNERADGVAASMRVGRYRPWAEDIGREVLLFLFEQDAHGSPVPEWRGALDGEMRRVVNRLARSFCPRQVGALDEKEVFTRAAKDDDRRESLRGPHLGALSEEFSGPQAEAMTRVCGSEWKVTQEKLAEAAGLPVRTFRRTVKRLRDHYGEA